MTTQYKFEKNNIYFDYWDVLYYIFSHSTISLVKLHFDQFWLENVFSENTWMFLML